MRTTATASTMAKKVTLKRVGVDLQNPSGELESKGFDVVDVAEVGSSPPTPPSAPSCEPRSNDVIPSWTSSDPNLTFCAQNVSSRDSDIASRTCQALRASPATTARERRIEEILRASIPVFAARGYRMTSMANIADAALNALAAPAPLADQLDGYLQRLSGVGYATLAATEFGDELLEARHQFADDAAAYRRRLTFLAQVAARTLLWPHDNDPATEAAVSGTRRGRPTIPHPA